MNETETQDQGQVETQTGQATKEQSETTNSIEETLYEMPDGKKVNAETLAKEWKENFYPDYTKKAQKLADYEKQRAETEARAEESANKAIDESELLKNVDPNVKLTLKALFKEFNKEQAEIEAQKAKDAKLAADINATLTKHDGKDGEPKADRDALVNFMIERSIYDPEEAYLAMTREIREDNIVKKALKDKGVTLTTETTGGEAPRKPQGKTPRTIEEATMAAFDRLRSS